MRKRSFLEATALVRPLACFTDLLHCFLRSVQNKSEERRRRVKVRKRITVQCRKPFREGLTDELGDLTIDTRQTSPSALNSTKALESISVEQPPLYNGQLELAHRRLTSPGSNHRYSTDRYLRVLPLQMASRPLAN